MKIFTLLFISCLSYPTLLFANGGPIDIGEIERTGNIEWAKKQNISLDYEKLSIIIDGDYANVNVEYQLKNHGNTETVRYAFPIDQCYTSEFVPDSTQNSLSYFKIEDNSGFLKTHQYNPRTEKEVIDLLANGDAYKKTIRNWFITDIPFKNADNKSIKVNYRVKSFLEDMEYSKSFFPTFSDRIFTYILKPSQNWGDGIVKKFDITIDTRKLIKEGGIIKQIQPEGYTNKDGLIIWQLSNFDLNKAEDLKVVYENSTIALSKIVTKSRIPNNYILSVKSSSTLYADKNKINYKPENVLDNDLNTVWAEGVKGNGIGEWIEFELDNVEIAAIGLISGYTKNDLLYYANTRVSEVKLDVAWNAHDPQDNQNKTESEAIDLRLKEFRELNKGLSTPFINWIADYGDGRGTAKKIRITITGIVPGLKYEDACISEIYILGNQNYR